MTVADRNVSGREALIFEYEGSPEGEALRFLALAVFDLDRVFLVTCAASSDMFPNYEKEFRACIESFRVQDSLQVRGRADGDVVLNPSVVIDLAIQSSIAGAAEAQCLDILDGVGVGSSDRTPPQPIEPLPEDLIDQATDQVTAMETAKRQLEADLANKRAELATRHANELARMNEIHRASTAAHERRKLESQAREGRESQPGGGLSAS